MSFLKTFLICLLVYFWGVLEFSFLWVVIFALVFVKHEKRKEERLVERLETRKLFEEGEENYLKVCNFFVLLKFNN